MVLGLGITASAGPANPYDKFRNASYSNSGLMSEQDEVRLGAMAHQQVQQQYRLVRDPAINEYVQQLGERLARASVRPNLQYNFFVIDDPSVNAFALPGGYIYVNTGLLNLVQSEEELAAALAHEIAHVGARHGIKNYKKAQRTSAIAGGIGILAQILTRGGASGRAADTLAQIVGAGILTRNSRDFEREADYLGLYTMERAGQDPSGMIRVFQRLGQASGRTQSSIGGIFASHPDSKERVRNTEIEIEQHLGSRYVSNPATRGDRPRRADRNDRNDVAQYDSGIGFDDMKRALSGAAAGRGGRRDRGYRNSGGYDPSYDPRNAPRNDPYSRPEPESPPADYDPPVLRRRNDNP